MKIKILKLAGSKNTSMLKKINALSSKLTKEHFIFMGIFILFPIVLELSKVIK